MDRFKQKLGPLPLWGWALVGLVALGAYLYIAHKGPFGGAPAADTSAGTSPDLSNLLQQTAARGGGGGGADPPPNWIGPGSPWSSNSGVPLNGGYVGGQPYSNTGGVPWLNTTRGASYAAAGANYPTYGTVAPVMR